MTAFERLEAVADKYFGGLSRLSEIMGRSTQFFYTYRNSTSLRARVLNEIQEKTGISRRFVETGEGPVFADNQVGHALSASTDSWRMRDASTGDYLDFDVSAPGERRRGEKPARQGESREAARVAVLLGLAADTLEKHGQRIEELEMRLEKIEDELAAIFEAPPPAAAPEKKSRKSTASRSPAPAKRSKSASGTKKK